MTTNLWTTLISILSEEEIIRFRKRADMKLEGVAQYELIEELSNELQMRELLTHVKPAPSQ
jgi:hypothetical protein